MRDPADPVSASPSPASEPPWTGGQHEPIPLVEAKPKPAPGRLRPWTRRLLWAGGGSLLTVGGLVALAPTLVSTAPGTRLLVNQINGALGQRGTLAIGDLSLGWSGDNRVQALSFTAADGRQVVVDEIVQSKLSLFGAVFGGRQAEVLVRGVHGEYGVGAEEEGAQPPPAPAPKEPFRLPEGGVKLTLEGLDLALYLPGQQEPVKLKTPAPVVVDAWDPQKISFQAALQVTQGTRGGTVQATGTVDGLLAPDRSLAPGAAKLDLKAEAKELPVALLEQMAGRQDDLFRTVLGGEKLEVVVTVKGGLKDVEAKAAMNVDGKMLAEIKAKSDGKTIRIERPSVVDEAIGLFENALVLGLDAPHAAKMLKLLGLDHTLAISAGGRGRVLLSSIILPLYDDGTGGLRPDLAHAAFDLDVIWDGDVQILSAKDPSGHCLTLGHIIATLRTDELGKSVKFDASMPVALGAIEGGVRLKAAVADPLSATRALEVTGSLPIPLADALADQQGKLVQAVGERLEFKATASGLGAERTPFTFALGEQGKALSGSASGAWTKADGLTLAPSSFHADLPAAAVGAFLSAPAAEGRLSADLKLERLVFNPADQGAGLLGVKGLRDLGLTLEAKVPVALADAAAKQEGRLGRVLGAELPLRAEVKPAADGRVAFAVDSRGAAHALALRGTADAKSAQVADSSFHVRVPAALLPDFLPPDTWKDKRKPDLAAAAPLTVAGKIAALRYAVGAKTGDGGIAGLSALQMEVEVAGLPGSLVDALGGGDGLMTDLLGRQLGAKIGVLSKDGALVARIEPKVETLDGTLEAALTGGARPEALTLTGAPVFSLRPEVVGRYLKAEQKDGKWSGLRAEGSLPLSLRLDGTRLALGDQGPDFKASRLALDVSGRGLALVNPADGQRLLVGVDALRLRGEPPLEALTLQGELSLAPGTGTGGAGTVKLDGRVDQPVGADGKLRLAEAKRSLKIEAAAVPLALADAYARNQGDLLALLGERLTEAKIEVVQQPQAGSKFGLVNGRVAAFRTPKAALVPVDFSVDAAGMLRLVGDTELRLVADEALARAFGPYIHPLLGEVRGGEQPVVVKVDGPAFGFNLNDPAAKANRVRAELSGAQLNFRTGGLTSKLLDALAASGVDTGVARGQGLFGGELPAVPLRLDGRELSYSGFRLHFGKLTLDSGGSLDWANKGLRLDMAIPQASLTRMSKKLDGMGDLAIPLSGSIQDPALDLGKPLAQIGKYFLRRELGDKAGGLLDGLLGGKPKEEPKPETPPQPKP